MAIQATDKPLGTGTDPARHEDERQEEVRRRQETNRQVLKTGRRRES